MKHNTDVGKDSENHKPPPTYSQNLVNFDPQTAKIKRSFLPTLPNYEVCLTVDLRTRRSPIRTQPNFVTCWEHGKRATFQKASPRSQISHIQKDWGLKVPILDIDHYLQLNG